MKKKRPIHVTIDSNIIISALIFGGKPALCLTQVYEHQIVGCISDSLIAEVLDVLAKKFNFLPGQLEETRELIELNFTKVYPLKTLNITRGPDDNRVLEIALTGDCDYIITGDNDLLSLKNYKNVLILTPSQFINLPS